MEPRTLADVDLFAPGAQEHWYAAYAILHEEAPVQRLPGEGLTPGTDAFVLTKYADISRVVKDWDRFPPTLSLLVAHIQSSGEMPTHIPDIDAMVASIVSLRPDPELWRAHRKELTDPWVGPGCTRHAGMIAGHVDALIAGILAKARAGEPVDFVADFARPLPQRVMASVLGFPMEDIPRLEQWGNAQVMSYVIGTTHKNILTPEQSAEKFRLLAGMKEYVAEQTREKRARPQDDMISFLTQVEYQALGRKLTDDEINGVVYAMVIGGLETTQYALAEQAQLLCERPGMFATLRGDRAAIRTFIEEGMRLRSPTQGLSTRICARDEVFQGVAVPAGSMLHLRWAAANIDPDEFDDPLELKLDRKAATRHLAFSQGPRSCPGSNISRLEQMIAWEKLCDAFADLAFAPGNDFRHQGGIMLGIYRLMLTLTPTETP
ncbi:cytochrome P450 [Erythrobacter sp. BLCC-B19]|uniref:cytochrome P450 n=1 Tax=Erythrobacter sp. BLCC-B19 TaxID=3025315 RepID=UPI00235FB70C|nr:cytochrome P450 [Erythrobacter sp. BLCC-B19]WDA42105.1 cytochrome P450 [Erythrobacter sp. BLCC-B19]